MDPERRVRRIEAELSAFLASRTEPALRVVEDRREGDARVLTITDGASVATLTLRDGGGVTLAGGAEALRARLAKWVEGID